MAKSPHYKANNKGGYGNPPVKNQFNGKPGPGRPKGSQTSIEAALRKVLSEDMDVKSRDGKKGRVNPVMSIAKRAIQLGINGKGRDNERAMQLAATYGPQDEELKLYDLSAFTEDETLLYLYLLNKLLGEPQQVGDPRTQKLVDEIARTLSRVRDKQGPFWTDGEQSED